MPNIKIKINDREIICQSGQTVMQAARDNGIFIPNLCQHDDFPAPANCRVCVVEIAGRKSIAAACSSLAEEGMDIRTDSQRVKAARNLNIELIFAEHIEKCPRCIWRVNCRLLDLADKYKIEITRFPDRKGKRKTYKFANAVELDASQCIDCRNCLEACNKTQKINFLKLAGKGADQAVVPVDDKPGFIFGRKNKRLDCIYCGQCAAHCPVGAAQEQSQWQEVEALLKDKNKIVIAQFAPSIRVSIGEEFGVPAGKIMSGQIVAGLKKLGFNYVFDVNFGADVTTVVEAQELITRLASSGQGALPMFTTCCPAWVKYAEFYHPELIPSLTTARSPHLHSAGVIKTYWAAKTKVNPASIAVVSIMPCTAKKFEAARPELKINNLFPIDAVITTRELAWLMQKNKINFPRLKPEQADDCLSEFSGAAAIYGASGGVMESALRTAQYLACQDKPGSLCKTRLEFAIVRGLAGVKQAVVEVAGKKLRVAVVNGIGHIDQVLNRLNDFDYIEVMACPGGCIGGGGQPYPTTEKIRQKRLQALYELDKNCKIRKAHENQAVAKALAWLKEQGQLEQEVLYTKYRARS